MISKTDFKSANSVEVFWTSIRLRTVGRAGDSGSFKVTFPENETEMLSQVHTSVQAALADAHSLLEVELPTFANAGRGVASGDCIAISEYNANQKMLRSFCELFEWLDQAERVRVFFPDSGEASIALNGIGMNPVSGQWEQEATFHNWPGPVDYLLRDDLITQTSNRMYGYQDLPEDMRGKKNVADSAAIEDLLYVIGYPYDSDDELLAVNRLWDAHARRTVIFNGNIDGVRTGFYPWGAKKKMQKEFVPKITTAYYIHNFRSTIAPGMLFRAYPGPWRVLRAIPGGGYECVQETEDMPLLRDIALEYFSGGLNTAKINVVETVEELSEDATLYYTRLGLQMTASQEDIVAAYRKMVKETHPDMGGDPMEFYEVNKAYAVLKEPAKRALYDVHGEKWVEKSR
ncbi:hypothetical protein CYMTET_55249 [Cymbomonas tetramitiformis]|uniref:J domain-containing protein n=1 Tax=Cymbomonas tetramitiformis TaxID=36881 RepID=A0AAE0BDC9_9CHLO|nr:hypothetical protein CYMTET_55249 [Cymbomonas tetramitiformis]